MGNCFSSSSSSSTPGNANNFSTPGRTLGSAPPPQPTSAAVPKQAQKAFTGANSPGRRLGSKSEAVNGSVPAPSPQSPQQTAPPVSAGYGTVDTGPGAAAARAAEERLRASQTGRGKLGKQLDAQRSRTQAETLAQVSRETRGQRDADRGADVRAYN